ncbi:MAG: PEGA domain-containing protein [Acidobacteriota bacterium]
MLVGIAMVFWLWTHYYDADSVFANAAPAAVAPKAVPAVAEPVQPSQDPSTPTPQPSAAAPAPVVRPEEARKASPRTEYVGTLSIDASPGGEVFVNREDAGATPLRLENIKAGSHLVWIERDGYRRWTKVVEVPADRVSRVFANLELIATQ